MGGSVIDGVIRVARAATEPASPHERAAAVLEELQAVVPFDHGDIAALDPIVHGRHHVLANVGYSDELLGYLHGPAQDAELDELGLHETGAPVRWRDVPGDALATRSIAEVLRPAGYREGLTMCLLTADGRETGVLNLSLADDRHPTDEERDVIASLRSVLANVADLTQSARMLAALLQTDTCCGVGLTATGCVVTLPGVCGHPLLRDGCDLPRIAAEQLRTARGARFLWPDEAGGYHRVTVLPCGAPGEPIEGLIALRPHADVRALTNRELEVLTMLTLGWSNGEIGTRLWISPRTVGTHVEQILAKLEAPTRAAAAARAVADGLTVPLG